MIICSLLSMVYGLCKPCQLNHVTKDVTSLILHVATYFKKIALLFNARLSFLRILSFTQLTNACPKLTIKKVD